MNFLAHAYLSFNHPQVLAGNMVSDFIKGKAQYTYPAQIQAGIKLHRSIDAFTDNHPATKAAQEVFRKDYRLYSGPLVDVLYDHFLASDATYFSAPALEEFSLEVYHLLETQSFYLPQRFLTILPYMKEQNWLFNYRTLAGTERSLKGLVHRAAYLTDYATAYTLFTENYAYLRQCYEVFFKDVKTHARAEFEQLVL